jgi:hypothetical protein
MGSAIAQGIRDGMKKKKRGSGDPGDSSSDDDGDDRWRGAKGAGRHEHEKNRYQKDPDRAFVDAYLRARGLTVGDDENKPFVATDSLTRLPCGSFATVKRALFLLLSIMEHQRRGRDAAARGLTAQGIRWLTASLYTKSRELVWKFTYLSDPFALKCVEKGDVGVGGALENALLDPRQVTAVLGLFKDLDEITKKLDERKPR